MLLKPPPLKEGGRIGVCSPAWYVSPAKLAWARQQWEKIGYEVFIHPQTLERDADIAGPAQNRAAALHDLFLDDSIDAIVFSDGGYGCLHLLEHLDFELIRKHPKIILGYSDITILLAAIHAKTGLVTFHGPSFYDFPKLLWDDMTLASLKTTLSGECPEYTLTQENYPPLNVIVPGEAEGPLMGGNHVRLKDLIATPFLPEMEESLFFTESNRPCAPDFDGNMHHLRLSGVLNHPRAVLLGQMHMVASNNPAHLYQNLTYNLQLERIMPDHFPGVPIIADLPFSHTRPEFLTFPLGIPFHLKAAEGHVELAQLEPATVAA